MEQKGKNHLETILQQELSKMFSSDFNQVKKSEVTPFLTVMKMIKLQYASSKPEVYKAIVAILHDYNPNLGELHRTKTVRYLQILLETQPELGEFLVGILPQSVSITTSKQPITNAKGGDDPTTDQSTKRSLRVAVDSEQPEAKKRKLKFYNYTPPVVSAYVASQGVPNKVTSITTTSASVIATTPISVSLNKGTFPVVALSRLTTTSTSVTKESSTLKAFSNSKVLFRKEQERRGNEDPKNANALGVSLLKAFGKQSDLTAGNALMTIPLASKSLTSTNAYQNAGPESDKSDNSFMVGNRVVGTTEEPVTKMDDGCAIVTKTPLQIVIPRNQIKSINTDAQKTRGNLDIHDKYLKVQIRKPKRKILPILPNNQEDGQVPSNKINSRSTEVLKPEPVLVIPQSTVGRLYGTKTNRLGVDNANPLQQVIVRNNTDQNIAVQDSDQKSTADLKIQLQKKKNLALPKRKIPMAKDVKVTTADIKVTPDGASMTDTPSVLDLSSPKSGCRDKQSTLDDKPLDLSAKTSRSSSFNELYQSSQIKRKMPGANSSDNSSSAQFIDVQKVWHNRKPDEGPSGTYSNHDDKAMNDDHLFQSQTDGTSDPGNRSLQSPNPLLCDEDGSFSSYSSFLSEQETDYVKTDCDTGTPVKNGPDDHYKMSRYTPLTNTAVKKLTYLSRLVDTPPPPDYSNQWDIRRHLKETKDAKQSRRKRRPKRLE